MMLKDEYFTYLGYIIIAILCFLIYKVITKKNSKEQFMGLFEGTDETKSEETEVTDDPANKRIQANIDSLTDATNKTIEDMNLVKDRKQWEDMIIAIEDRVSSVSLQSISILAAMIKANPNDDKIVTVITRINEFNKYRETLKENMKYLDGLK
jgi:hypothetical protein